MYVFRELTDLSYPAIARLFGGRDHTTVIHAVDKIQRLMKERKQIYDQVTDLVTAVEEGLSLPLCVPCERWASTDAGDNTITVHRTTIVSFPTCARRGIPHGDAVPTPTLADQLTYAQSTALITFYYLVYITSL